ncbi:hypothetical protein LSTR_LSTR000106 [Laodelphax striatellus]|uniref:Uncharacterized protein n=1 Tax=Laodelphax striatellus TaxID=195883 RepID=A0A482X6T7_LAOST|nr:hypothetical protein LSTR_LSTR000106 [Laodelphax striatellus]
MVHVRACVRACVRVSGLFPLSSAVNSQTLSNTERALASDNIVILDSMLLNPSPGDRHLTSSKCQPAQHCQRHNNNHST